MNIRKKASKKASIIALASLAALGLAAAQPASAQYYKVVDLAPGQGGTANAISPSAKSAGQVGDAAALFNINSATNVGFMNGTAYGINDVFSGGVYVGTQDDGSGTFQPTIFDFATGTPVVLDPLFNGAMGGEARGVNDLGCVVGDSYDFYGTQYATVWYPNGGVFDGFSPVKIIPLAGGFNNIAYGINNLSHVVGTSDTGDNVPVFLPPAGHSHAFYDDLTTDFFGLSPVDLHPTLLKTMTGTESEALAIGQTIFSPSDLITGFIGSPVNDGPTAAQEYLLKGGPGGTVENLDALRDFGGFGIIFTEGHGVAQTNCGGPGCFTVTRVVGGTDLDVNGLLTEDFGTVYKESTTPIAGFVQGRLTNVNTLLTSSDRANYTVLNLFGVGNGGNALVNSTTGNGMTADGSLVGYALNRSTGTIDPVRLDPADYINFQVAPAPRQYNGVVCYVGTQSVSAFVNQIANTPGLPASGLVELCSSSPYVSGLPTTEAVPGKGGAIGARQNFGINLLDVPTTTTITICAFFNGNIVARQIMACPWLNALTSTQHKVIAGENFQLNVTLNALAPVGGLPLTVNVTDITNPHPATPGAGLVINNGNPVVVNGGQAHVIIPVKPNPVAAGATPTNRFYRIDVIYMGNGPTNKVLSTTVEVVNG